MSFLVTYLALNIEHISVIFYESFMHFKKETKMLQQNETNGWIINVNNSICSKLRIFKFDVLRFQRIGLICDIIFCRQNIFLNCN